MELLLTPILNRLLRRVIKSADGESGSQLRVSLSGGSVVLHHLELNLDSVLGSLPISVHRAFARQLKINIAWTALASQPIEVVLDTVEVVLALNEKGPAKQRSPGDGASTHKREEGETWMGSLTNLLLRTLFNVSISINNLVVKYLAPTSFATLTCQSIVMRTAADGWQTGLAKPESWLMKTLEVKAAALWLDERKEDSRIESSHPALLRLPKLEGGALLPIFALLEGQPEALRASELKGVVDLGLEELEVAIDQRQIEWLRTFVASIAAMQALQSPCTNGAGEPAQEKASRSVASWMQPTSPDQGRGQARRMRQAAQEIYGTPTASGVGWLASGALSAAGRAWSYVTDDAAVANAANPVSAVKSRMALGFTISLKGGSISCLYADRDSGDGSGVQLSAPDHQKRALEGEQPLSPVQPLSPTSYLEELELASPKAATSSARESPLDTPPPAAPARQESLPLAPKILAVLRWQGLHAVLEAGQDGLRSLDVGLAQVSILRQVKDDSYASYAATPVGADSLTEDEVFGLYPVEEVDSAALRGSDGSSLAARVRWQTKEGQPAVSASLGLLSAAYAAGFAADIIHFVAMTAPGQPLMYGVQSPTGVIDTPKAMPMLIATPPSRSTPTAPSLGEEPSDSAQPPAGGEASTPAWMKYPGTYSLSVLCLQASALSTTGPDAEAITLAFGRISAHLGPLKTSPRPGSLSASLFGLQEGGLPGRGLRISFTGVQLGASTEWEPALSRRDTALPSCVEAVSLPMEVQVLVSSQQIEQSSALAFSGSGGGKGGVPMALGFDPITEKSPEGGEPAGWVLTAAVGPIQAALTGDQVAALMAIASGLAAEGARGFRVPLPARSIGPGQSAGLGRPSGLKRISLETPGVSAMYSSGPKAGASVAPGSYLVRPTDAHGRLVVGLASLSLGAAAGKRQSVVGAMVTVAAPVMWAIPNAGLHIPALDVRLGRLDAQPEQHPAVGREGSAQSSAQDRTLQRSSSLVSSLGKLLSPIKARPAEVSQPAGDASAPQIQVVRVVERPAALVTSIRIDVKVADAALRQRGASPSSPNTPEAGLPSQVAISLADVSAGFSKEQWAALVVFGAILSSGPVLPVVPGYPPATLPTTAKQMHGALSLRSLVARLSTAQESEAGSGIACTAAGLTLTSELRSCWADETPLTDNGYPAAQALSQRFLHVSASTLELATIQSSPHDEQIATLLRLVQDGNTAHSCSHAVALTVNMESGGQAARVVTLSLEAQPVVVYLDPDATAEIVTFAKQTAAAAASAKGSDSRPGPASSDALLTQLDLRATVMGVRIEANSQADSPAHVKNQARVALAISDVVLAMNDVLASQPGTWSNPAGTRGDISLEAASLTLWDQGLPSTGAILLQPCNLHLSIKVSPLRPRIVVLVADVPVLAAQITPAIVAAGTRFLLSYSRAVAAANERVPGGWGREGKGAAVSSSRTGQQELQDDLRCSLFELSHVAAARPGPLQISYGDKQPGLMPWSGEGESWICWRYPHRRPVAALVVALPSAVLAAADLELLAFSDAADSFVPVAVEAVELDSETAAGALPEGVQRGVLLVVQGAPVATEEWQLCWECSGEASHCRAAYVLHRTYVNPDLQASAVESSLPGPEQLPAALPVPWTFAFCAGEARIQLLLDGQLAEEPARVVPNEIAAAETNNLKAVVHLWRRALSLSVYGALRLVFNDDVALTEETLLESCCFGLRVEHQLSREAAQQLPNTEFQAPKDPLPISISDAQLVHPIVPPTAPGTGVHIRLGNGPSLLRVSELGLCTLMHIHAAAVAAWSKSRREYAGPDAGPNGKHLRIELPHEMLPPRSAAEGVSWDHASTSLAPMPGPRAPGPADVGTTGRAHQRRATGDIGTILVENQSGLLLEIGQIGTTESRSLGAGEGVTYCWAVSPAQDASAARLLRMRTTNRAYKPASGDAEQAAAEPPNLTAALAGTAARRASHSAASTSAPSRGSLKAQENTQTDPGWSAAFDVMAAGMSQCEVALGQDRGFAVLAVHVHKAASRWHTVIRPGCLICNCTPHPLQLCLAGPGGATERGASPAQEHIAVLPPSGKQAAQPMYTPVLLRRDGAGKTTPLSTVRVWLGPSSGWSNPVPLQISTQQVITLSAGGFGAGAPPEPPTARAQAQPGLLHAQLAAPAGGQFSLTLWPAFLLCNELPCPLRCRLTAADSSRGDLNSNLNAAGGGLACENVIAPGTEAGLAAVRQGSEGLAIRIDLPAAAPPGAQISGMAAIDAELIEHTDAAGSKADPLLQRARNLRAGMSQTSAKALEANLKAAAEGWSRLLLTGRRGAGYTWGTRPGRSDAATVPEAGQRRTLEVPCAGRTLCVDVIAEAAQPDLPCLRLRVVPHAVLHNCTDYMVSLHCPGAPTLAVQGQTVQPLDWQSQRPRRATLSITTTMAGCLCSAPFAIEPGDALLSLHREQSAGNGSAVQPLLYLGIRTDIQPHPVPAGQPPLETVHVTVTAGLFATNLTPWNLSLQPKNTLRLQPALSLVPEASLAIDILWRAPPQQPPGSKPGGNPAAPSAQPPQAIVQGGSTGVILSVQQATGQDNSRLRGVLSAQGQGSAPQAQRQGPPPDEQVSSSERPGSSTRTVPAAFIALPQPQARQRVLLDAGEEGQVLVSYRVVASRGHLHLVLFRDRQPPAVLRSNLSLDLEVGYFPPEVKKLGEVQYEAASCVITLLALSNIECELSPLADFPEEQWEEQEDEEGFLERVTGQRSGRASLPGVLKFRQAGSRTWSDPCYLEPGCWEIGDLRVSISECCATTYIEVAPQSASAQEEADAQSQQPVSWRIECDDLQVCFWDDERRRWSRDETTPGDTAALARELFCLSLGSLSLHASRSYLPGVDGVAKSAMAFQMAARSLQVDSFLEHSRYPVLCVSLLGRHQPLPGLSDTPLLLHAEVLHALTQGASTCMSFRNTWLRSLALRLPTLSLAVDDALVAFIERSLDLLASPRPPSLADAGDQAEHPPQQQYPSLAASRSPSFISPTRGSTYFDLSKLDSLDAGPRAKSLFWDSSRPASNLTTPRDWPTGQVPEGFAHSASSPPGAQIRRSNGSPSPYLSLVEDAPGLSIAPGGPYDSLAGTSHTADLEDGMIPAMATLEVELVAEATAASASRLLIEHLFLGRVSLLLDLHVSQGSTHIPVAIDTHRTPVSLLAINARGLLFRPSIMLQGLLAHYAAEALLNAPAVLGSLDLLLNPTGLVHSVGQGFEDLVALPLAALEARSPSQFIAGLGLGSASLLRHVSGWTLTSISGFSSAFARVLERSLSARSAARGVLPSRPSQGGITEGLQGLAGGVTSGVTGLYRAPMAGYGAGSSAGLALGLGRGILGAVGLPISGALDLVSSMSAGLAATAGVSHTAKLRRPPLVHGKSHTASSAARYGRIAARHLEQYVVHCVARSVTVTAASMQSRSYSMKEAAVVLTRERVLVLRDLSDAVALSLPLRGLGVQREHMIQAVVLSSSAIDLNGKQASGTVRLELDAWGWHLWWMALNMLSRRAQIQPV